MGSNRSMSIREKKRKQRRRKKILVVLLAFLLTGSAAALIVWNVFTVKTVLVEGNEHYSDKQIQQFILNDEYSWNSLYVLLKHRLLEGEEIPFIDTVEISLKNPHTLNVHVYEKGVIGYLYISAIGQNAYFDTDGFVVETSKEVIEGTPQVEGLDCDKVVLYEKLPIKDENVLKSLLTTSRALEKNGVIPAKIQFGETGDISLDYGAIQVLLGSSEELTQKILRLSYILPELSGKRGVLHIENWTENTPNIIFDEAK